MFISTHPSGPFETNAYIVACEKTKKAALIDPGVGSFEPITTLLKTQNFQLEKILLTHSHWDHIADVSKFKVPVYIHSLDIPNLENPGADRLPCWVAIEGVKPSVLIDEETLISVGNLTFHVIHTPGHTPGGVCFYNKEEGALFSGDTLFKGSIGNLSFPTCEPDKMWDSLKKLENLPRETKVFPGHGPATTIGEESWLPQAKKLFDS